MNELRICDLDRENAVRLLGTAMAYGRITPAEFSERCRLAYAARTRTELLAVLSDLPFGSPPSLGPLVLHVAFGQLSRTGQWPVPELIQITGTGQRTTLDFTETHVEWPEVVIEVNATMSATKLLLPPSTWVNTDGLELVVSSVRYRRRPRRTRRYRADSGEHASADRSRGRRLRLRPSQRNHLEPPTTRFVLRGRAVLSTVTIWQARLSRWR